VRRFNRRILIDKGVKAAGARKSTLEMEKLLKEFRKLSIEESNSFYVKSLTKIRTLLFKSISSIQTEFTARATA
jgi:hypothetical protein